MGMGTVVGITSECDSHHILSWYIHSGPLGFVRDP